jgi:hypothetical protein
MLRDRLVAIDPRFPTCEPRHSPTPRGESCRSMSSSTPAAQGLDRGARFAVSCSSSPKSMQRNPGRPVACLENRSNPPKLCEIAAEHSTKVLEQYRIRPEHQGVTFLRKRARGVGGRKLESSPPDHSFGTLRRQTWLECPSSWGGREVRSGARRDSIVDPGARQPSATGAALARGACFLLDSPFATSPVWRAP